MKRVEMLGLNHQNLPTGCLGLRQLSLMKKSAGTLRCTSNPRGIAAGTRRHRYFDTRGVAFAPRTFDRSNAEAPGPFAALPKLPHLSVCRLDAPAEAIGIEERVSLPVSLEPLTQGMKLGLVVGQ